MALYYDIAQNNVCDIMYDNLQLFSGKTLTI